MKKYLNTLSIISLCIIASIIVLLFYGYLEMILWVKYVLLVLALIILVTVYINFGKKTEFDECLFCLKKARKSLQKLNFQKKSRIINLSIIRIKNYISFAQRYMENIYSSYDLHSIKSRINDIKELKEHITKTHIADIRDNQQDYVVFLQELIELIKCEDQKRKDSINKQKREKKQSLKNK